MSVQTPDTPPEVQEIQHIGASQSSVPLTYANHTTALALDFGCILEFRSVVPDTAEASTVDPGKPCALNVELDKVPPHVRLSLPHTDAMKLRDILNNQYPAPALPDEVAVVAPESAPVEEAPATEEVPAQEAELVTEGESASTNATQSVEIAPTIMNAPLDGIQSIIPDPPTVTEETEPQDQTQQDII